VIFVAIFEMDRVYGGPEEGGWWYDAGELKRIVATFSDEDQAYEYSRRFNRTLHFRREARRNQRYARFPLSSVNYSGGHYQAEVWKEHPHSYPVYKPQYE
jgi:Zn-finger nucleic acid-binding protein